MRGCDRKTRLKSGNCENKPKAGNSGRILIAEESEERTGDRTVSLEDRFKSSSHTSASSSNLANEIWWRIRVGESRRVKEIDQNLLSLRFGTEERIGRNG
jgi:hypothetical protein